MATEIRVFDAGAVCDLLALKAEVPKVLRNATLYEGEFNEKDTWSLGWQVFGIKSGLQALDHPVVSDITILVDSFRDELRSVCPAPKSRRRARIYDVDGDEFRDDLYREGRPECWEVRKRVALQPQNIKLYVKVGGNSVNRSVDLCWTGAAVCAAVDLLEDAGYRVEIFGVHVSTRCCSDQAIDQMIFCKAKDLQDSLSVETVGMVISNGAFFRSYWFKAICCLSDFNLTHSLGSSSGITGNFEKEVIKHSSGDQYFVVNQTYSREGALESVKRMMLEIDQSGL